jgi:hypothetical protein
MKNKQLYLLSFISTGLLLQTSGSAAPLVSIGDNADLFFNGSSSLRWSSNVFRDEDDEKDDLIWTLSPGFELNVGRGISNADFSIITRYDIVRYEDLDDLDTELFHIKALGSYKTSRLDLSASASFDESKTNSGDDTIDDLIEYDTVRGTMDGEYRISPKFSVGSGVRYTDKNYTTYDDQLADREVVTVPLDVFYELTPKVDLSIGYAYTHTDVEDVYYSSSLLYMGDYETSSHFFNVGARGYLLPKLSGFFKVGYRTRSSDDSSRILDPYGLNLALTDYDRDDSGMLGLDADLTWSATPKVTVRMGLSRDFGVGGEGDSTENTSVDLSGSYAINSNFSASANLGYTLRDYIDSGRRDNQYRAGLRLSYLPNQYWRFSTGYSYSENDSDRDDSSYENHMIDLTATLRY